MYIFTSKLIVIISIIIAINGCANDGNDTNYGPATELQGRWINCFNPTSGSGVEIVFQGARWSAYSGVYSDSNCANRISFVLIEQGRFLIGDDILTENSVTAREIDVIAEFGVIESYRTYFDIYHIEQDQLYLGKNVVGDFMLEANRPTNIDDSYSLENVNTISEGTIVISAPNPTLIPGRGHLSTSYPLI